MSTWRKVKEYKTRRTIQSMVVKYRLIIERKLLVLGSAAVGGPNLACLHSNLSYELCMHEIMY